MSLAFEKSCLRVVQKLGLDVQNLKPCDFRVCLEEYSDVEKSLFYYLCVEHLAQATDWITALKSKYCNSTWYIVIFNLEREDFSPDPDHLVCANSFPDALDCVIRAIDNNRLCFQSVKQTKNVFKFFDSVGLIATIKIPQFEKISVPDRRRARSALKGLNVNSELSLYRKKLKKIYGLKELCTDDASYYYNSRRERTPVHLSASNLALAMRTIVKQSLGLEVAISTAQDLVAIFWGFQSWHEMKANERKHNAAAGSVFSLEVTNEESTHPVTKYCVGTEVGLCLFGLELKKRAAPFYTLSKGYYGLHAYGARNRQSLNWDNDDRNVIVRLEEVTKYKPSDQKLLDDIYEIISSENVDSALQSYFCTEFSAQKRAIFRNAKYGIPIKKHIQIGNWVFWKNEQDRTFPHIYGEHYSEEKTGLSQTFAFPLYKAWLEYLESDKTYVLYGDYQKEQDRRVVLTGLSDEQIDSLVCFFLTNPVWVDSEYGKVLEFSADYWPLATGQPIRAIKAQS